MKHRTFLTNEVIFREKMVPYLYILYVKVIPDGNSFVLFVQLGLQCWIISPSMILRL